MERWAANTLASVVGIIVAIVITLLASSFLMLMSFCDMIAGGHPDPPYWIGAVVALVAGIGVTILLARGLANSAATTQTAPQRSVPPSGDRVRIPPAPPTAAPRLWFTRPLRLSPAAQKTVDLLVWAMIAQITISIPCWLLAKHYFWRASGNLAATDWTLLLMAPFFLYRFPYLLLIFSFLREPENRTLVYAVTVPAMLAAAGLMNIGVVIYSYIHSPVGFLLLLLPWSLHIVIVLLAWRAAHEAGLQPDSSSLFRAGVITFGYFLLLHIATPFLFYLFFRS